MVVHYKSERADGHSPYSTRQRGQSRPNRVDLGGQRSPLDSQEGVLPLLLMVKRHVVLLLVVHMQLGEDRLHHAPVEGALGHVLAPVLPEGLGGWPQVVPGDLGVDVVGHVPVDVVAQPLHPPGVIAVHSASQLGLGGIPLRGIPEGDVGGGVVHHREGAHPEVVANPRHQPELDPASDASVVDDRRPGGGHEGKHRHEAHNYAGLLLVGVLVEVKVPQQPVPNGGEALEGGAQDALVERALDARPLVQVLRHHRVPGSVLHQLVGVCVVVVVLDPPGLKGVDERRKHQRAHNILHKVVLVEGAVASIVADGEEPGEGGAGQQPGKRQQVPGRHGDEVQRAGHGAEGADGAPPGLTMIELKNRLGQRLDDLGEVDLVRDGLADGAVAQVLRQSRTLLIAHVGADGAAYRVLGLQAAAQGSALPGGRKSSGAAGRGGARLGSHADRAPCRASRRQGQHAASDGHSSRRHDARGLATGGRGWVRRRERGD
mmetsp:Transcript_4454/g.11104  ORF Transcript_4454/g.11104 Transcript_4454/m.11104 type:complete len:488 (-) Transcript_4454:18-1481(-)